MPNWSQAIAKPAEEFPLKPLPILSGEIPDGLRGTLYRNGPGRLERGDQKVGHWFDGDGAILAIHLTEEGATATYRYVQTEGYQKEAEANRYLYPNYGMTVPGPFWKTWGKDVKNVANTSVLALPEKLLALWEGGNPYALNLHNLETKTLDNLDNLNEKQPFSAHPKIDPETGIIYNFGISLGAKVTLNLYKSDRTGKVVQKSDYSLEGLRLIHDFVLAGSYIIFFVPPVRVKLLPAALGFSSLSDAMEWKPELGTEILIFDRDSLSFVTKGKAAPWFQWHYSNGYVDEQGNIIVEFVRYPDFSTNQNLKEIPTGKIKTPAKGTLWEVEIDPKTAKVIRQEQLLDRGSDFPIIPPHQTGQNWRYTYLSVHRENADLSEEILGIIARYDRQLNKLTVANMEENLYASEPIFVPNIPNSEIGWVLTVVYDGNEHRSELRIYDSEELDKPPLCRLGLPNVIPMGFHGTWKAG
ncbi:carotenoid oxygenase family protein [Crocosphaera chwakensis]|uniref:Retinal pigment epithelial membrane protein n=1 Tax=Crocosphaera chwakensis CCY0110 TaxID=391612 RepID=A3IH12_9CHRO|nr:carotenoid oxygenase family protein [Crocosphaera chwakensis]EAZ94254.1 Retinal pigment epithelial membrane protein [Crocosphaera chwakensis CCY0110]